jgi:cholesterol transport system auxiliary component
MRRLAPIILATTVLWGCSSGPGWQRRSFAFASPADPPTNNTETNIVALSRISISPLFQSRSFTYRTAENAYEQDPYAGFLIPPERALAESIRASLRAGGVFGRVVGPGSGLVPTLIAEVTVNQLYGDFRQASKPVATMEIHFVCYEVQDGNTGRVVLDKVCARETPLTGKTPAALMAAWDVDLREIMHEIHSEYAKANSKAR